MAGVVWVLASIGTLGFAVGTPESAGGAAAPNAVSTAAAAASGPVDPARQRTLTEFWERRVFARGVDMWSHDDMTLLRRIRRAEAAGALDLLNDKMGGLRGYAVAHRSGGLRRLWLTKEGFEQYEFLKSQLARQYFEDTGTDAAYVFKLRDLRGKRLFNGKGLLTPEGEQLYDDIAARRSVQWKDPGGELRGNARPPRK